MHGPIADVYRRIRRNRIIEIRVQGSTHDDALRVIHNNPKVRDVQIENMTIVVELEGDDEDVASLHDQFIERRIRLRSFNDKDPTLEDVFMLVTKGLVA